MTTVILSMLGPLFGLEFREGRPARRRRRDARSARALRGTRPGTHGLQWNTSWSLMASRTQRAGEEPQSSRHQMMAVVDRERRRIERDLHDGTQQRLTSIVIKLELLRDLVGTELKAEVDDISRDAATAIDELRRLVHGMYPRGLHEGGLSEGLRMLARGATLPVSVIHRDIERCDPAVEAAVYFCVAEAVQNASKHAGAGARVTVTLERNEHNLTFEVADDGVGFDTSDHASGLGLLSLRDRIEAIGGKLTIDSTPGKGTVIRGMTPNGLATQFALSRSSVDPPNSRARTSSAPNLTADGR